jgi:hypothetical protein
MKRSKATRLFYIIHVLVDNTALGLRITKFLHETNEKAVARCDMTRKTRLKKYF